MAQSYCSVGVYPISAPFRAGTKILGVLSPVVSATLRNPYLLESQIQLTQMVTLLGRRQSFNRLHKYFCLLKDTSCSDPQSHTCPFFTSSIKDGGTVPGGDYKSSKPLNPYEGLHLSHILRGLRGLHLIKHSFCDNVWLKPPKPLG